MMINTEKLVGAAQVDDTTKAILREYMRAINILADKIQQEEKHYNSDNGHYYRIDVKGTSTISITATDLGVNR